MKLQIDAQTKIKDVQQKFTEVYPFLKVEFYKEPFGKKVSAINERLSPDRIIIEEGFKSGSIDICRHRTVAALEKEFYEKFGIALLVSRKSGNNWIATSKNGDKTLKAQNQLGKAVSSQQPGVLSEEEIER